MSDWDDDESAAGVSCYDPATHQPRLLAAQCATCILRPGNLMHLQPGRLAELMHQAVQQGSQGMICHDTLPGSAPAGYLPALCRGFYDQYGPRNNFVRVMERLGGFTEVPPPTMED